jgi:hypothetical protein
MLHVGFDRIASPTGLDRLPIRLEQSNSRGRMVLLIPVLAAVALPLLLLARHAFAERATLALLSERPSTAIPIVLGLAIWLAIFIVPLHLLVARTARKRRVDISADTVQVAERRLLRRQSWSAPLSTYRGVTHFVRSTLSGVRHELILVHPDPDRHVLLTADARISQARLEHMTALLRLPEVSARALYRF